MIDDLRRRVRVVATFDPEVAIGPDRADTGAEQHALAAAIASALDELAPEIRAAFVLRAYHELTYPEIAAALEIDLGTVKSRLWRAITTEAPSTAASKPRRPPPPSKPSGSPDLKNPFGTSPPDLEDPFGDTARDGDVSKPASAEMKDPFGSR